MNTLRSILDHAVYASALALGESEPEKTKFPFGDTAKQVQQDAVRRGRCHPVEEMRAFLIGLQPHRDEGGNKLLWALNHLRNKKNHRALVQFGVNVVNTTVTGLRMHGGRKGIIMDERCGWDGAHNEFVYMVTGASALLGNYDFEGIIFVEIGKIEFLAGQPAVGAFGEITREVVDVAKAIEAKTEEILSRL